jgi:hypothetical protein
VEFRSFGVGIGVGILVVTIAFAFFIVPQLMNSTNDDSGNSNEAEATFSVAGYVRDISQETLTISQCKLDECFENSDPRESDIHIDLTRAAALYNCGIISDNSVADCVEGFRSGKVPIGTAVCANVRMVGGELYGSKIFFGVELEGCEFPPRGSP